MVCDGVPVSLGLWDTAGEILNQTFWLIDWFLDWFANRSLGHCDGGILIDSPICWDCNWWECLYWLMFCLFLSILTTSNCFSGQEDYDRLRPLSYPQVNFSHLPFPSYSSYITSHTSHTKNLSMQVFLPQLFISQWAVMLDVSIFSDWRLPHLLLRCQSLLVWECNLKMVGTLILARQHIWK